MEQSEPVNPRVMSSERTAGCVYDSTVAAEISGYIDIGMKDEALRLSSLLRCHESLWRPQLPAKLIYSRIVVYGPIIARVHESPTLVDRTRSDDRTESLVESF